jgi:hypothetical protein
VSVPPALLSGSVGAAGDGDEGVVDELPPPQAAASAQAARTPASLLVISGVGGMR